MGGFSVFHWLILLLIIVVLFGATKLPKIGEGLGRGIKAFRKEIKDFDDDDDGEADKIGMEPKDITPKKRSKAKATTKRKYTAKKTAK